MSSARRRRSSSTPNSNSQRNKERYAFLRWGQTAFKNFAIVPPDTGIVHQINLEYLARVVFVGANGETGKPLAYPDTLVGTDSHTTMINGLGVLGWGVGGIEAEAAMLGQPVSMLIPQVVGVRLKNQLREGSTATDLVLTVTEMLRKKGVVGKFVEFFGPGLHNLPLADRATIANMAPEYGATCGIFPVDEETLRYLRLSGRTRRADQPGRGLLQGAGTVPHRRHAGGRVHRRAGTRPGDGRAEHRRPEASAGPRAAVGGCEVVRAGAAQLAEARPAGSAQAGSALGRRRRTSRRHGFAAGRCRRARRAGQGAEPRQRGHRRHHQLHQHLEPVGAGRRRTAGEEGGREGPDGPVVGEDLARARLDGGHRIPHALRPDALPGEAEVPPRRLRMHHLHRQLRPAAAGSLQRHHRQGPGGRVGAQRQSQLRRPHQLRGARQLPDVAAAGGGLRARRPRRHRHVQRAARLQRQRQAQAGLPEGHLADRRRKWTTSFAKYITGDLFQTTLQRRLQGRRALARSRRPGG